LETDSILEELCERVRSRGVRVQERLALIDDLADAGDGGPRDALLDRLERLREQMTKAVRAAEGRLR